MRKDGGVRWVAVTARMVTDAAGRPLHTVGVSLDITVRKLAEAEYQSAQRLIATTLESITDGFTRLDRDWRVVYLNDAAERMNQRPRTETLGKTVWEMFPALIGTQLETAYRRCVAEQVTVEFDFHHAPWDVWFAIKCYPVPDGGLAVSFHDITDAKRTAEALQQSEARFRAGIEAVSDIVWTNDARGLMVGEQVAWGNFTGQDLQSYQGYGWSSAIHPDDAQPTIDAWNEAVAGKKEFVGEHRVRRRDGQWRLCTVRVVPVLDERGDISEWVGVHNDITDQVAVDAALRASEERLRMALAAAQAGAWAWDISTGVITWSPENYVLYGYDPLTSVPPAYTDWAERIHPDDRDRANAAVADTLAGRTSEFRHEFRVIHPARGERWLLGLGQVERSLTGEACRLVGINLDITDRVAAETALRVSEERFRTLFNSMDEGFCVVEMVFEEGGRARDYRVIEMNSAFEKHTGISGLVGRSVREAIPDLEEFWYETYGRVAATGEPTRFVRETAIRGGRWLDAYAFRLGAAGSNKVAILFNDITASRLAEEAVMASEARSSFLVTLADTLRSLSDPTTIQAEAGRVLGERLGASRVYYFEVGRDDYVVERDYTNAALSMVGRYPIASFGPNPLAALRAGCTTSEADVDALLARTPEEKATFAGMQIRSYIAVPLVKGGTFVAGLAVHAGSVRTWTPTEIAMAEDTAERTWAAVERVRAEAALRVSEERLRMALEAAELGTWHVDPLTRLTQTDERFRAIFGTTYEWTDYLQLFAVMHPDDLPGVEAAVAAATRPDNPEPYAIEYRINRPDGALRWVFARGRATYEDGELGRHAVRFDGTVQDITDRKRAEQALRDSEARLGGILRRSPAGIIQTDAAGCMTLVNPRWLEMTGLTEVELLGRNILDITHPSSVAPTAAAFGRLAAGGADFQIETDYRRKDGSTLRAQSNVAAIRSPSGEFLGLIAVILDISERLRSEEELRRLAADLAEAARRKDEFLATLAHELRNPLAPIRNGLQVMRLAGVNPDVVEKTLGMMERQVGQLIHLIDDLMDLSRISAGKIVLQKARLSLADVIRDAVDTSRPLIEKRRHALVVNLPPEPVCIDADRTRLVQMFGNLLNNAAKYTETGGRIRVTVECQDGDIVVAVEDNGVGIAAHMLTRVFDMFAQVDRTLEKSQGGLGIGLSIAKRLAEMHDGSIVAESGGHGSGSRFVVRLPLALNGTTDMPGDDHRALKAKPARRRVLVVDDNRDGASSLAGMLDMMGNDTQTAFDGAQAVDVAEAFKPDVILMDIGMPKLNGYDACRRIREQPWGRNIVIVAQTGWGQEDDRRKAHEAGFDFHMVKPVEPAALEKMLIELKATIR